MLASLSGTKQTAEKEDLSIAELHISSVPVKLSLKTISTTEKTEGSPVLEMKDLYVARANANITLVARAGDRIGISGRSGVGKSQVLRTIAGLEENMGGDLWLRDTPSSQLLPPEFRVKVCLVPQSRPTLEGTPRMFYEDILRFNYQRCARTEHPQSPIEIAQKWRLKESVFDQQWSTLSGGEAQRASLAIALALQPQVLLLDESTSALDESTCKLVEGTLIESRIPIVTVTHSKEQLTRFCTHQMDFS
jgi:ABC-type iron transport system FetAB ATPase subunit